METIIVYLDNMFASLPKTREVMQLKQELLSGMEDKYLELKRAGKSENEAIGIVISEFGNIEELTAELGIESAKSQPEPFLYESNLLTEEEVYAYTVARKSTGFWTGLGVALCIAGVALLLVFIKLLEHYTVMSGNGSMDIGVTLGLIAMFILITVAIGMFIYSGMKLNRFKYLEQGFQLPYSLKLEVQRSQSLFAPTYRFSLIMGVCLCVLSPALIIGTVFVNEELTIYGVAALLLMIAMAVFLFVYYGNIHGAYAKLLEDQYVAAREKEEERVMGAVGAIIWPLTVVVFLITGFVFNLWHINWIVFPVVGILHGMLSNIYQSANRKKAC